jgi:ATP-dependent Clp protease adaptor protein ClpS|tara:strand:- start:881 stop:1198 length:318 start_codon:yes stop_codon:yes gene_type:complete
MTTDVILDEKIVVDTTNKKETKEPSRYNVIMLNDDSTPMEWVIGILKEIFKHTDSSSEALTMTIHSEGSAVVGTYKYEIAEQKSVEATTASRNHGFPLQIKIEEE